jgi:hypothetical protein
MNMKISSKKSRIIVSWPLDRDYLLTLHMAPVKN